MWSQHNRPWTGASGGGGGGLMCALLWGGGVGVGMARMVLVWVCGM